MRKCVLAASGVASAAGATTSVLTFGSGIEIYGLSVMLMGAVGVVAAVLCGHVERAARDAVAAYDLGEQLGYDRGYREGRRVARPVVVPHPSLRECEHDQQGGEHVRSQTAFR